MGVDTSEGYGDERDDIFALRSAEEDDALRAEMFASTAPTGQDFPFKRNDDLRAAIIGMKDKEWTGHKNRDLLVDAMETDPSDPDVWIGKAMQSCDPDKRNVLLDAGLRLAWSGIPGHRFDGRSMPPMEGRRDFSLMTNDERCVVSILALKGCALLAAGRPAEAYKATKIALSLDHRDAYGTRFLHAALAVLNDDRRAARRLIEFFNTREFYKDGPSMWSLALLEAAFGDNPAAMEREAQMAYMANDRVHEKILSGGHSAVEAFDRVVKSGMPCKSGSWTEADMIAGIQTAAWQKLGTAAEIFESAGFYKPSRGPR